MEHYPQVEPSWVEGSHIWSNLDDKHERVGVYSIPQQTPSRVLFSRVSIDAMICEGFDDGELLVHGRMNR